MVKELSLIGSFFATMGAILQILTFRIIFLGYSWTDLQAVLSPKNNFGGHNQPLPLITIILLYFGIFLIIFSGFNSKKKIFMIFGGVFMVLGILATMIFYISGLMFHYWLFIVNAGITIGAILYFIGIIQNRRYNKVAIISSALLLSIMILTGLVFGGFLLYFGDKSLSELEPIINMNIVLQMIQGVIFTLHGWVFSFTKKIDYNDNVEEDTLSVEDGKAFTSHVPDDMKKKKKKKKIEKIDRDITFNF